MYEEVRRDLAKTWFGEEYLKHNLIVKEGRSNGYCVIVDFDKNSLIVNGIMKGYGEEYLILIGNYKHSCEICGRHFKFYDGCLVCERCKRVYDV